MSLGAGFEASKAWCHFQFSLSLYFLLAVNEPSTHMRRTIDLGTGAGI